MRSIFFAPHSDDECLFGAFTLLKYQPTVVICFPSSGDYGDTKERFNESVAACMNLGVSDVRQWMTRHDEGTYASLCSQVRAIMEELKPDIVWGPSTRTSHPDHRLVSMAVSDVSGDKGRIYETYDGVDYPKKMTNASPAPIDDPKWIAIKHFVLTKYQTQIAHPRARQFFTWSLDEYAEQP